MGPARIVAVTLAMARKSGFGRLSMRQIASKLGVTATALYHHFRDKNELLERVSGDIMDAIPMPDPHLPWQERLRRVVLAQQTTLLAHPGLARFLVQNRESAGALRWTEMILTVLDDASFTADDKARALATLTFLIHPRTLVDDRPHRKPERLYRQKRLAERLQGESRRYPHLIEVLPTLTESPYETYLPIALDGVIAGIAAGRGQPTI